MAALDHYIVTVEKLPEATLMDILQISTRLVGAAPKYSSKADFLWHLRDVRGRVVSAV